jgi:hypothetical protein
MPVSIRTEISDSPAPDIVHRLRNFREIVFRALENKCTVSINEIDRSTTYFDIHNFKNKDVGNVTKIIKAELNHHNFNEYARLFRL